MKNLSVLCGIAVLVLLGGCAHPISVVPAPESIVRSADSPEKLKKKVGFFISPESLNLEVTTQGGGGDNVRYFPYRDIEAGYQRMLSNVFDGVVRVSKANDPVEFERGGLAYIFTPEMITSSGSTGFFTWPPTNFSVDLTSKIRDTSGKLLSSPRVIGVGSFPDGAMGMNGNFGITGQLAMQDALLKKQAALFDALGDVQKPAAIGMPSASSTQSSTKSVELRLLQLKDLFDKKLIDETEYNKKRNEILNGL